MTTEPRPPIAVVGLSCLFPGSVDKTGFWKDILAGRDLTSDVPPSHWLIEDYYDPDPSVPDKTYVKRGAFLDDVAFDPLRYGVPPKLVAQTDTSQLLALIVANKVLEDAGEHFHRTHKDRMGIVLGVTSGQELMGSMASRLQRPVWTKALRDAGLPESKVIEACERIADHYTEWGEANFPGLLGNVVAGRVANHLDLGGFNNVTDAACASSLSALTMAVNSLYLRQSDVVITGGVDTMNDIFMYVCFSKTPALSPTGDCRPFSDKGDGTLLGEGLAMVALKRLDDAERDGDHVYGVIRGVGGSSDGRGKSVYAPVSEGQAKSIRRAYEEAGIDAESVELIEAHGTGTIAGDAAEFGGLRLVYGTEPGERVALGSVKSQIGHTKSTAGAAGLFKAVLAVHHKVIPPTAKVDQPNPKMDLANSPFYLPTKARPWVRSSDHARRAGVSSFGFGGSNFHAVVEEYTGPNRAARLRSMPAELVVLTAADAQGLVARIDAVADLADHADGVGFLAAHSQATTDLALPARLAFTAADSAELAEHLAAARAHLLATPGEPLVTPAGLSVAIGAQPGQVAFLFPGQGSQYVDMGAAVAMNFDAAAAVWTEAADVSFDEESLASVIFPPTTFDAASDAARAERVTATEWAQPGIGVTSLAIHAVLSEHGLRPDALAGHSFGEVTALSAAGVLSVADAIRVARRRGELMRDAASTPGAMTAAKADISAVSAAVDGTGVVVANHNGPRQVVLSGPTGAVDRAEKALESAGIAFKRLAVATAFHSEVVSASAAPFTDFLSGLSMGTPGVPVVAHSTAQTYSGDVATTLGRSIALPVRWVEQVEALYASGVRTFVEVGPGNVLTKLVGRILGSRPHLAIETDRKGRNGVVSLLAAMARLAVRGVPMNLADGPMAAEVPTDPRTVQASAFTLTINGANYNKPYPPKGGAAALPKPNPEVPATTASMSAAASPVRASSAPAPSAHAPSPSASVAPASVDAAAILRVQEQTAAAHAAYQQSMAQAHTAFLATVDGAIAAMSGIATGEPAPIAAAIGQPHVVAVAPPQAMPLAAPVAPAPARSVSVAPAVAPSAAPPPVVAPAMDLNALLLDVVSESTGYPTEMLQMSMSLEGDLGIDSIKRVEILSGVRDENPDLPELDAAAMGALVTLQEIADFLAASMPASAPVVTAAPSVATPAPAADLTALLLGVVSESTGYPTEMLKLSMSLEGDLGIDSIKRVEILSGVRDQNPDLPELDAAAMGALVTLQEIADFLNHSLGGPSGAPAAPTSPSPTVDLTALLLGVVSESTGYPTEMLKLSMSLEGDLGIDSIKRVEILSGVRDQNPDLPELDAAAMGALVTLQEIADFLNHSLGGPAAATAHKMDSAPTSSVQRFAVSSVPAPRSGLVRPGFASPVVVTNEAPELAAALVAELQQRGFTSSVVDRVPQGSSCAISLAALGRAGTADAAIARHLDALGDARALAPTLASGGAFVTVQDTGGDLGLSGLGNAWVGGLPGLVKTAAIEWPNAMVKAIDIERDDRTTAEIAHDIVDEVLTGGPELEVGLDANGARSTLVAAPLSAPTGALALSSPDVVVVSGGARGVTAACAIELARQSGARFVLLGRTPLVDEDPALASALTDADLKRAVMNAARQAGQTVTPAAIGRQVRQILAGREIRHTLTAITEAGGHARYDAVDVTDNKALFALLQTVKADWGPVTAIVHGAGVLADKLIADKTRDDADRVLRTKLAGLEALLAATVGTPLKTLALFSSVAARAGNRGQSDYAMANEVLNRVASAYAASHPGTVVRSIGWGPWAGGMVTPALEAHFAAAGIALIGLEDGATRFVNELRVGGSVEVVIGGSPEHGAIAAGPVEMATSYDIRVSRHNAPWLADHTIADVPVLPVVMAVEWFVRAASAFRPGLCVQSVEDVKVRRGIQLGGFENGGDRFRVSLEQTAPGVISAELTSSNPTAPGGKSLHYTASIRLAPDAPGASAAGPPDLSLSSWDDIVYGDVLFHGPDFQVIDDLHGVADEGIRGTLNGMVSKQWPADEFHTDVAALDGGLQLAVLWNKSRQGGAFLPTRIASFRPLAGPVTGRIRCTVSPRATSDDSAVSDLWLVDDTGRVVAELRGVETRRRPSGV